jgi:hypothetical protein
MVIKIKLVEVTSLADTWHMAVQKDAVQCDSHSLDSSHSGSVVVDQVIKLDIMTWARLEEPKLALIILVFGHNCC